MDITQIKPDQKKALFFAKKQLPEFVCDAVNLEGIHYTLPEVQTLLDGVSVGGHKLSDQTITLNQANAWKFLFATIENNTFALTKTFVCELHGIAAQDEALEWGRFRTGQVTIAGSEYLPPKATQLDALWQPMIEQIDSIPDIYPRAIALFLQMARHQFFYDVNKRMGRFMMNGILLQAGYPAINLPAKRQLEFNQKMLRFYETNHQREMIEFMISCLPESLIKIMSE